MVENSIPSEEGFEVLLLEKRGVVAVVVSNAAEVLYESKSASSKYEALDDLHSCLNRDA